MRVIERQNLMGVFSEYNKDKSKTNNWERMPSADLALYKATKKYGIKSIRIGTQEAYYKVEDVITLLDRLIVDKKMDIDPKPLEKAVIDKAENI